MIVIDQDWLMHFCELQILNQQMCKSHTSEEEVTWFRDHLVFGHKQELHAKQYSHMHSHMETSCKILREKLTCDLINCDS